MSKETIAGWLNEVLRKNRLKEYRFFRAIGNTAKEAIWMARIMEEVSMNATIKFFYNEI